MGLLSEFGKKKIVEYFDPFALIMPHEIYHYLIASEKKIVYS